MNRVINIKLCGNYLSKDNKIAGVRGEANVTKLRITFDEDWDGYAKKITFWDAHGTNPVKRIFTADCIEDILKDSRTYLIPIPHEPMAEAGMLTFVIDGYVDDKRQRSISDKLEVKDAPMEDDADNPIDPTPTQAEQLQVQIDTIINDIQSAVEAKEDIENMTISYESLLEEESNNRIYADSSLNERINKIKYYGDADIEISPDEWFVFNDEEHTILGGFSEGHENETSIVIPYSVTTIDDSAFYNCESLTSVTMPNSVTTIRRQAFGNCTHLTSVTISDGVTSIGDNAFRGCSSLTNVIIPNSVRSIGDNAFIDCISLTSVEIPDSVTSIGQLAFFGCISLTSVIVPDRVTSIGKWTFDGCSSLKNITIGNSVTSIGDRVFVGCRSLINITVNSGNKNYVSVEGNLFDKNQETLIQYAVGKQDTQYIIPNSVTRIDNAAFSCCTYLTSVTIPDRVTKMPMVKVFLTVRKRRLLII